jgi:hypothetical protein
MGNTKFIRYMKYRRFNNSEKFIVSFNFREVKKTGLDKKEAIKWSTNYLKHRYMKG